MPVSNLVVIEKQVICMQVTWPTLIVEAVFDRDSESACIFAGLLTESRMNGSAGRVISLKKKHHADQGCITCVVRGITPTSPIRICRIIRRARTSRASE